MIPQKMRVKRYQRRSAADPKPLQALSLNTKASAPGTAVRRKRRGNGKRHGRGGGRRNGGTGGGTQRPTARTAVTGERQAQAQMVRGTGTKTLNMTRAQSLQIIKNLLRVSVSQICEVRGIFSRDAFVERRWAGQVKLSFFVYFRV